MNFDELKPFEPEKLPLKDLNFTNDPNALSLLLESNRRIGEYKGFLSTIINPMLLISPIISQEAV